MTGEKGAVRKGNGAVGKMTLAKWIIAKAESSKSYCSGTLTGAKHPRPDKELIRAVGGLPELIRQAKELERQGYIRVYDENMGADIKKIEYSLDIIPKLCKREGIEDPRKRQMRYIEMMEKMRADVKESFLESYYEEVIKKLQKGEKVSSLNFEDKNYFLCLNAIVNLENPMWKRVFSAAVLHDSKRFEKVYEKKVVSVLRHSPLFAEGMSDDEILSAHGILSYAQVMEWKGPLQYKLESTIKISGQTDVIDSSENCYGTMINSQTLEHAVPFSMKGIQKVITIENKANYEDMKYRDDTLYLYCHGFYSPKERRFLQKLISIAEEGTKYFHWGDMDLGGIRIFRFNKANIFPELKPYKMDRKTFCKAVEKGAGIPLEEEKRKSLERLDAGELEDLKNCILEMELEIEQESYCD